MKKVSALLTVALHLSNSALGEMGVDWAWRFPTNGFMPI